MNIQNQNERFLKKDYEEIKEENDKDDDEVLGKKKEEEEEIEVKGEEVRKIVPVRPNSASLDFLFLKRFFTIMFTKIGLFSLTQFFIIFFAIIFSVLGALMTYWGTLAITKATVLIVEGNSSDSWIFVLNMVLYALFGFLCDFMTLNGFLTTSLSVLWRRNLTKELLNQYFKNKNYYVILNLQEIDIDNPDQRIQSDAKDFCFNLSSTIIGGIRFFAIICVNFYVVLKYRGYWLLIPVCIFPFVSSCVYVLLFYPTSKSIFRKDSFEGDFRFSHARIREHAESMAFFQSEDTEKKNVEFLFRRLVNTLCCLGIWMFFVTLWTQITMWFPNVMFISIIVVLLFTNTTPFDQGTTTPSEIINLVNNLVSSTQIFASNVSNLLGLASNMSVVIGNTARIGEMFEAMDRIEIKELEKKKSGKIVDDPNSIQFEGVSIRTPNGKLLLNNLDLKLVEGEHVIIMGPSGSGKSSILRILCGLWNFERGMIARPPNIGNNGLFFLPQKPYMVSGSLRENIIYPFSEDYDEEMVSDEQLIRVMELAKIDYLLKRASLHDNKVFWEEKLSLGEQQRLQLARLFFHKPRFAVLDECTSALDPENEDALYSTISQLGITMLSIAHRKSVLKYHKWILEVNNKKMDGRKNYEIRKIKKKDLPDYEGIKWVPLASHKVSPEERDMSEEIREEKSGDIGKTGLNFTFIKRVARLFCCCIMIRQWWLCCFITFSIFTASVFAFSPLFITTMVGRLFGCLIDRNVGTCVAYTSLISIGFVGVAIGNGITALFFMCQGICCRANITYYLHNRYFRKRMFYDINIIDKQIDNPDQRICSDIDLLTSGFQVKPGISYMEYLMIGSLLMVVAAFVQSWTFSCVDPLFMLMIILLSGFVQLLFMIALSKLRFVQQKREGFFRNSLTRMKEYSEQIAFFDGKEREEVVIRKRLRMALWNQLFLGFISGASGAFAWFVMNVNLASIIAIVIFSIRVGAIDLHDLSKGDIVKLLTTNTQVMASTIGIWNIFLSSMVYLGQIIGTVGRVSQMIEKMDEIEEDKKEPEDVEERRIISTEIGLENATVETPTKKKLFYKLSFIQDRNMSVLIQGPSGCGKSSCLRVIANLWKLPSPGKVFAPPNVGRDGLFFLPQKPYLVLGTLKENVIYPHSRAYSTNEELLQILNQVNLGYIYDRMEEGWDSTREWSVVLSPGEQQRIGMARLLYHKPAFAILDESTSALDEKNEALMYETCKDSRIAALSVGHRKSIIKQHSHLLEFDGYGGWIFSERVTLEGENEKKEEEEEVILLEL